MKLADFGFVSPINPEERRDGLLKTCLGTLGYRAPEIKQGQTYHGKSVDIFAAGIVLFMFVLRQRPFGEADAKDRFFKLLLANRADLFWKEHEKILRTRLSEAGKITGLKFIVRIPQDFKDLIQGMLQNDPAHRPTANEVLYSAWMLGDLPTPYEIQ